jgi:carbon monoxide dehydrogenase subunit G
MQFQNMFTVPLPPDEAWGLLMDVERIAPCMPGAELTEVIDKTNFKGRISVRLGPVALTFDGTVKLEDVDEAAHTARIKAQGSDSKGRGGAQASASFQLEPVPEGTTIIVDTDLILSGAVAQYGRGTGIIQATANQLIQQFSACLKVELSSPPAMETSSPDGQWLPNADANVSPINPGTRAKPISGFALMWKVFVDLLRNRLREKR